MNRFTLIMFAGFSLCSLYLKAQSYEQQKVQLQFFNHYGKVYQRGSLAPNVIGSEYFNDDWQSMNIKFRDTLLRFEAVKINLLNANLEVLYQGEEKMIANSYFDYVEIAHNGINHRLRPVNGLSYEGKNLQGFVEFLGEGNTRVVVQHYILIREPHNQAHITGGFTANRLIRETNLFLYDKGKLFPVNRKNDLQDFFKNQGKALEAYLKANNPDIKDPQQLLRLVDALSSRT